MKHGGWIGTELGAGDNRTSQQAHVRTPGDVPKVLVLVSRSSSVMRYNDRGLGSTDKVRTFVVDENQFGARSSARECIPHPTL